MVSLIPRYDHVTNKGIPGEGFNPVDRLYA